ncbi:MAG: dTDP-4-dehydrorhamnose reductase [Candidatus Marinamargulisbacteria bacterium]
MRLLCLGGGGLVATALKKWLPELSPHTLVLLDRQMCDITHAEQVAAAFETHQPTHVINAAAMTDVDACETAIDRARNINGHGVKTIASHCHKHKAVLVHFSTDYVFNGAASFPYSEDAVTDPINMYGQSKLMGDQFVRHELDAHYILRVQWVFGHDKPNFIDAILKKARQGAALRVVNDQFGSPTSAQIIAKAVVNLILNSPAYGVYHFRTLGHTHWCNVAQYCLDVCGLKVPITPVSSAEYPRPAARPKNGVLNTAKWVYADLYTPPTWQQAIDEYLNIKKGDD